MSKGTFSCSSYCATNGFPSNIKEWPIGELIFGNKVIKMSGSAPTRPNWLVNDEKESKHQGEFFKRLQNMKESLLQTEEYNLRNAIARIENKKYGRRRMVLTAKNYTTEKDKSNPRRFYNSTSHEKYHGLSKFDKRTGNPFSPLREKGGIIRPIDRKSGQTRNEEISVHESEDPPFTKRKTEKLSKAIPRQRYSETNLFNAKKNELAKIATNLHNCESDDSYSLIRNPDALPSIPSVGHRKSFTHKNRFRAMTWESEFSELPKVNSKGARKQSEVSPPNRKKPLDQTKTRTETTLKKKSDQELKFDVNPKDREIFKHLNTEIGHISPKLPTPPVNSRLANHSGNTIVPQIVLPNMEDEGGESDSARSVGDLNSAMQKLVIAHTDLESLKEELKDIANINDDLQGYEAIEGCSTKL